MVVLNKKTDRLLNHVWNTLPVSGHTMVYIGRFKHRPDVLHWGNPFSHNPSAVCDASMMLMPSRNMAVVAFGQWISAPIGCNVRQTWKDLASRLGMKPELLREVVERNEDRRQWMLHNVNCLHDHDLVCWCSPKACHGDVLVQMLELNQ